MQKWASLRIQVRTFPSANSKGAHVPQPILPIAFKNRLLASLPPAVVAELSPHMLPVVLHRNQTLAEPHQRVDAAYFLEDGLCSIVATMENGMSVEVGLIGRDGVVGMPVVLGTISSPNRYFMQIPGFGLRVKANILSDLVDEHPELRRCLQRSVHGLLIQTAQTAACNRLHELHERLARWLLMCSDMVESNNILITQEFLATMLGTLRSSVTVAAATIQKEGLITIARGRVTIHNHAGLEDATCECYKVVHNEYIRLGLLNTGPLELPATRLLSLRSPRLTDHQSPIPISFLKVRQAKDASETSP